MYNIVPARWNKWPTSVSADYNEASLWDSLRKNFDEMFMDTTYYNKDGNIVYEIEVPGFNKDNLSIDITNNILTIKGDRNLNEDESHVGNRKVHKRLSLDSNFSDVDAVIKDGILYVTLMKTEVEIKKIELK